MRRRQQERIRMTAVTATDPQPETGSHDLDVVGSRIRILIDAKTTGGSHVMVHDTTPPGGGPPPHIHSREDETFYILEGELEFLLGDRWVRKSAGDSVFGKRGIPHTYRNVGTTPSRMIMVATPAGFERFFEEVDRMSKSGPPTPEALIELGGRYGLEFLPPPA
jgi:quercetin dioxygenase-like cupin family protein